MNRLCKALQVELDRLYHNATPNYPTIDSDYEQDLFDSCFSDHCSMEIADLKYTLPDVLDYGKVYTWGRGGRTVAPDGLVNQRGGSTFSIKEADYVIEEYGAWKARSLIKVLREFNDMVVGFNKYIPEWWEGTKEANDWQIEIDINKNRRRTTRVVYV